MEVEVERISVEELLAGDALVVARHELGDLLVADARRVLGQEAALGDDIETREQAEPAALGTCSTIRDIGIG